MDFQLYIKLRKLGMTRIYAYKTAMYRTVTMICRASNTLRKIRSF